MNGIKRLLIILLTLLLSLLAMICHAYFIAPNHIGYQFINIYSTKIDPSFDNVKILFFADLDYGEYFNQSRLDKAIDTIQAANADIIVFGGDIFSDQVEVTDSMLESITHAFSLLQAPLGKFYVTGEKDIINNREQIIHDLMKKAQFECINNTVLPIRNTDVASIQLVGLSNMINQESDINDLYNQLSPTDYTFAICHTPDIASSLPSGIDRMMAADSHGGQLYIPFVGGLYETQGCKNYQHGSIELTNFTLDINNGLGTTIIDARLNAPAQVTVYTLHSGVNTNQTQ